jgi:hypothetical protein
LSSMILTIRTWIEKTKNRNKEKKLENIIIDQSICNQSFRRIVGYFFYHDGANPGRHRHSKGMT